MIKAKPLSRRASLFALGAMMIVAAVMVYAEFPGPPFASLSKGVHLLILWFFCLVIWAQLLAIADIVVHRGRSPPVGPAGSGVEKGGGRG